MQEVLNLRLKDVGADVAQRPAASAIRYVGQFFKEH